jgi:hypothetical protein
MAYASAVKDGYGAVVTKTLARWPHAQRPANAFNFGLSNSEAP